VNQTITPAFEFSIRNYDFWEHFLGGEEIPPGILEKDLERELEEGRVHVQEMIMMILKECVRALERKPELTNLIHHHKVFRTSRMLVHWNVPVYVKQQQMQNKIYRLEFGFWRVADHVELGPAIIAKKASLPDLKHRLGGAIREDGYGLYRNSVCLSSGEAIAEVANAAANSMVAFVRDAFPSS
jgi:hypothetical protein